MTAPIAHNVTPMLNPNQKELFQSKAFELLVYGGAGGGKSYSIADKFLLLAASSPVKIKAGFVRKTLPSLKKTVISIFQTRAEAFKLPLKINQQDMIGWVGNLEILFLSCHSKESVERIKGLTDVDFFWCNELPELLESDYELILTRVRGGKAKFQQVIGDFNPIGTHSWVYKRWFEHGKNGNGVKKLRYNLMDNHPDYLSTPGAQAYKKRLEATKDRNPNFYKIYFLGEWGELEGLIYNWNIVDKSDMPTSFDEIFYGGDFGFSVDPAALVRIYRKSNHFWLEEVFYETEWTNDRIAIEIKSNKNISPNDPIYWDSAEPKSIRELRDRMINAKPAVKGADSVRAGIDYLKDQHIYILSNSPNIIKEHNSYVWRVDKDGDQLPEPVKFFDHTMDAARYGIYTHLHGRGGGVA